LLFFFIFVVVVGGVLVVVGRGGREGGREGPAGKGAEGRRKEFLQEEKS